MKVTCFFVQFLDINEAVTEGETLEEALFNAREVLTLTIESRIEEGMEIPFPSQQVAGTIFFISPSSKVQAALLMRLGKGSQVIDDVAVKTDTPWSAAKGLENTIIHQY